MSATADLSGLSGSSRLPGPGLPPASRDLLAGAARELLAAGSPELLVDDPGAR